MKKGISHKLAMALLHEKEGQGVPTLVAKGWGKTAERMLEVAEEADIPIHQDETLAQMLRQLDVPEEIPSELYESVAKILAFIYKVDQAVERKEL